MPFKNKELRREHYWKNRERLLVGKRLDYHKHKHIRRAQKRQFKLDHPEIVKEWKRRDSVKNAERYRRKAREWRLKNKDRADANARAWKQQNRERVYANVRKRQALELNCPIGDLNEIIEWQIQWKRQLFVVCHWCKSEFRPKDCHSDHIIPLAKSGKHELKNLCIACKPCNLSKGTKLPEEFLALLNKTCIAI